MCPVIHSMIQYFSKRCDILLVNGIYTDYNIHKLILATLKINKIDTAI